MRGDQNEESTVPVSGGADGGLPGRLRQQRRASARHRRKQNGRRPERHGRPQEIEEGTPVYADVLNDGTYDITVESSSSMFNIEACQLTVADGKMTAAMTMGGTGYLYVFPGTGEEAAAASEDQYISLKKTTQASTSLPSPWSTWTRAWAALRSARIREMWYDPHLGFPVCLSAPAGLEGKPLKTVADLSLADGTYQVVVSLEGGSGRASVTSPTKLVIADGKAHRHHRVEQLQL
ncbi:MAG: hypothetical protein ACLUNZ_02575 [Evtepia sp.]